MVLGARTSSRRNPTLQRDFLIHLQEIKPWPPSQSLRTLRSVLIQWEHGEKYSGSTNTVVPLLGSGPSGTGDGKIEFDESFRLTVTLVRDTFVKGGDSATFQKSYLELNLYEPRRDKTVKGQLLGTAVIDFADYGVVKEVQTISVPVNSNRIYNNATKPLLYLKIQSIEKGRTSSSSRESLPRVLSIAKNGGESVSDLMNEEYAEEAEFASITDDDVSSQSSVSLSSPAFETNGGLFHRSREVVSDSPSEVSNQPELIPAQQLVESDTKQVDEVHGSVSLKVDNCATCTSEMGSAALNISEINIPNDSLARVALVDDDIDEKSTLDNSIETQANIKEVHGPLAEAICQTTSVNIITDGPVNNVDEKKYQAKGHEGEATSEGEHSNQDEQRDELSENDSMEKGSYASDHVARSVENLEVKMNTLNLSKMNHVKSVRSSVDSARSNGSVRSPNLGDCHNGPRGFTSHGRRETKIYTKETKNTCSDGRIVQLERKIKMLEGELREAAAVEVGLYSIIAEHGSSTNKVHAPARRLSRLYLHACKESSKSRRESAARSAVSGLIVVVKACGHDVPRLTYWLSNTVVLRAIIEQQLPLYVGPSGRNGSHKKVSPIRWKESSTIMDTKDPFSGSLNDWEDPQTFTSALERVEAWIFSRVIESIWWQTLIPHMQSAAAKEVNLDIDFAHSKSYKRTCSSGDKGQVNVSLEIWKKAFRESCKRLCPVRAGGHECGCLPVLARLIMEQCVARLDVAMFNAILRESDDEIPTDPVSDPISDAKVVPIPAGKASFGAGAQLKNAIGNWSRWLTDLFGLDDDSHREKNDHDEDDDNNSKDHETTSKCFHLLNALSDLMMLPKDMLLSQAIRKEVCPIFGALLIKRVLSYFVPDEFCPDPIPEIVFESLDSEDPLEEGEYLVKNFPCSAAPTIYMPPPSTSLCNIIGEIGNAHELRSRSSVLRKSYTSDDELDELDSPLTGIINGFQASTSPNWKSKENGSQIAVRYQLLREVWLSGD